MTITYEEALSTLSSMFSTYTSSQLDAVLRHHGGHMEHTVETLLSHTGSPDELIARIKRGEVPSGGPAATGGGTHNIDADEELARQLAREDQQQQSRPSGFVPPGQRRTMASNVTVPSSRYAAPAPASAAAPVKKGRGTPTTLPMDFLRIPGQKYPIQQETAANPNAAGGGMTDEQLARMLQDELFQEELRLVFTSALLLCCGSLG
jgi:hypothetical protein